MSRAACDSKEERAKRKYEGVPRGPYYKWYVEWLQSPEGQRVAKECGIVLTDEPESSKARN